MDLGFGLTVMHLRWITGHSWWLWCGSTAVEVRWFRLERLLSLSAHALHLTDPIGEINAMNVTARNESVMAGASPPVWYPAPQRWSAVVGAKRRVMKSWRWQLRFPKAWILHIEQEGNEKPIWRREEIIGEVEKKRKWLMRLPRRKKGECKYI